MKTTVSFFIFLLVFSHSLFAQNKIDRSFFVGSINSGEYFQLDLEFSSKEMFGYFVAMKSGEKFDVAGILENGKIQLDVLNSSSELIAAIKVKNTSEKLLKGTFNNITTGEILPVEIEKIADYYAIYRNEGLLEISATYPQYVTSSVAALEYSEHLEKDIIADLENFWDKGESYLKEDSAYVNTGWSRDINCQIVYYDESLSSTFYSIYEFTGGAHGMTYFSTENVAFDEQEFTYFGLAEFFNDDEDCSEELSDLVIEELEKQAADWVISGEISEFDLSELHVFTIKPDGLEFAFAPYEVSAYARVPHFVFIPYSEIYDCLDMLSPIGIFFR